MIICENNTVFAKSDFWSKTRQPAPVSPMLCRVAELSPLLIVRDGLQTHDATPRMCARGACGIRHQPSNTVIAGFDINIMTASGLFLNDNKQTRHSVLEMEDDWHE